MSACAGCEMNLAAAIVSAAVASVAAVASAAWVVATRPRAPPPPAPAPARLVTYFRARAGKKLHALRKCRALAQAKEVTEHEVCATATRAFYEIGALCVHCAGPHALV